MTRLQIHQLNPNTPNIPKPMFRVIFPSGQRELTLPEAQATQTILRCNTSRFGALNVAGIEPTTLERLVDKGVLVRIGTPPTTYFNLELMREGR